MVIANVCVFKQFWLIHMYKQKPCQCKDDIIIFTLEWLLKIQCMIVT